MRAQAPPFNGSIAMAAPMWMKLFPAFKQETADL